MIGASLQYLAMRLNLHLRQEMSVREDLVVVSKMLENDGKEYEDAVNKLNIFLVNMERDSMMQNHSVPEVSGDRAVVPPKMVFLNLYFVIAANFNSDQTVRDIKTFVEKKTECHNFSLVEGFPPKVLNNLAATIEQLNIKNSLITQKLK